MENEGYLRVLYLYQILLRYSDEEHPLSTNELIQMMKDQYQIEIYRTTVAKCIASLNACGMEVVEIRSREKKYFLNERPFELAELKLLIDAVESSRFISEEKTRELVRKLVDMAGRTDAEKLKRNVYTAGKVKTVNQKIFYIIDVINEAINTDRRISFLYTDYDAQKKQIIRNAGEPYILSPFSLIWNGDYYYLLGYNHIGNHIATFRIDHIVRAPDILGDTAIPMPTDFNISGYASEVIRMYDTKESVWVTLLCENQLMRYVIDQYGIEVDTKTTEDEHFVARVQVCPSSTFFSWVFGWCGKMQIIDPPEVLAEYELMLDQARPGK